MVLSDSANLQNICPSAQNCFPVTELPNEAEQGTIIVRDSVQLCDITEIVDGERFCSNVDPDTSEIINCPLFDYQNEPTDRSK